MQLPLIAEAGMGATHLNARQMSFRGMATIGVATYLGCLSQVLAQVGAPTGQPVQVLLPWVRAELLEGSHLLGCVDALLTDLRQQWAVIETRLVQPNPERFPASVYRFEG